MSSRRSPDVLEVFLQVSASLALVLLLGAALPEPAIPGIASEPAGAAPDVAFASAARSAGLDQPVRPEQVSASRATSGRDAANRVLIIGIDGLRPDALTESDTPNLDRLVAEGAYSLKAQTGDITHSGPGWSSLLTGVWRDKHGVDSNGFTSPRFDEYPHFFTRLKAFDAGARTASIVHWAAINERITPPEHTDVMAAYRSADDVATAAVSLLRDDPELEAAFVHFEDADTTGHGQGFDPPYTPGSPYRAAIEREDARVGRLLDALSLRENREQERWLILVATDHGGTGRAHGQDIPEHRTIFYIAAGDAALRGEIEPAPEIVDVAVTALAHLGVPIDPAWQLDGKVVGLADPPPAPTPPFHGTIFIDPDILTDEDPTSFEGAAYAGRGMRTVYDRRPANWVTIEAYLFDLRFDDGLESEAIVNPEFGSEEAAEALALQYGEAVGRLPTALRRDMDALWIHAGTELYGGGNRSILIHTGQSEAYIRDGILEETLIHEAAHTSLDADHANAAGWLRAQELDGNFISTYARDNPLREDVAESFVPYLAERYRRDRIAPELADTILETIPNRMDYLDAQGLDLYPMVREEAEWIVWLPALQTGAGRP